MSASRPRAARARRSGHPPGPRDVGEIGLDHGEARRDPAAMPSTGAGRTACGRPAGSPVAAPELELGLVVRGEHDERRRRRRSRRGALDHAAPADSFISQPARPGDRRSPADAAARRGMRPGRAATATVPSRWPRARAPCRVPRRAGIAAGRRGASCSRSTRPPAGRPEDGPRTRPASARTAGRGQRTEAASAGSHERQPGSGRRSSSAVRPSSAAAVRPPAGWSRGVHEEPDAGDPAGGLARSRRRARRRPAPAPPRACQGTRRNQTRLVVRVYSTPHCSGQCRGQVQPSAALPIPSIDSGGAGSLGPGYRSVHVDLDVTAYRERRTSVGPGVHDRVGHQLADQQQARRR